MKRVLILSLFFASMAQAECEDYLVARHIHDDGSAELVLLDVVSVEILDAPQTSLPEVASDQKLSLAEIHETAPESTPPEITSDQILSVGPLKAEKPTWQKFVPLPSYREIHALFVSQWLKARSVRFRAENGLGQTVLFRGEISRVSVNPDGVPFAEIGSGGRKFAVPLPMIYWKDLDDRSLIDFY